VILEENFARKFCKKKELRVSKRELLTSSQAHWLTGRFLLLASWRRKRKEKDWQILLQLN